MKKLIWKALPSLGLVLICATMASTLEGLLSIYTMKAIDAIYSNQTAVLHGYMKYMLYAALALMPATLLLAGMRGLYKRKAVVHLKHGYMTRLFNKNINEFQRENNAVYLSAVTNDLNVIENSYIDPIYEVLVNMISFVVSIIVIGTVSVYALFFGVVVGGISTLISVLVSKPLQKHQKHRSELYADFTAYIKEALSAFHIIKSNDLDDKVRADYFKRSHHIQHKGYIIDKIYTYISALNRLNFSASFFVLIGITAYMGIKGQISIGGVVLVATSIEKILQPISQLSDYLPKILGTKPIFEKLENSLKNIAETEEDLVLDHFSNEIVLADLSFGFEDHTVLSHSDLTLKKGGKYMIVGPSGGGKSTLLRLLRKYYTPWSGVLNIDDLPLSQVTKNSYFSKIANVEQAVFLFEDSIRNNLTLYKEVADDAIVEAMHKAGLSELYAKLPDGLDTKLVDNGKNLSGGEKSRMAIARALVQKAEIIFLDEAFASLDALTAIKIEEMLLGLQDVTVINVSHVKFDQNLKKYDGVVTVKNKQIKMKEKIA